MTVRANHAKVLRHVVPMVTVNVVQLQGNGSTHPDREPAKLAFVTPDANENAAPSLVSNYSCEGL